MTHPLLQLTFYFFSAVLLGSAVMVITSRQPVRAVLFLVLVFFCSSVLWMLLQAEFLALVLIFVYVGAVMTLFLFVVMMLNVGAAVREKNWLRYLPLGLLLVALLLFFLWRALSGHMLSDQYHWVAQAADYNNTKTLGLALYTDYFYPFELAAVLLLVAIVAAIALAFRGRKDNTKAQQIAEQLAVRRAERVQLIDVPVEKK